MYILYEWDDEYELPIGVYDTYYELCRKLNKWPTSGLHKRLQNGGPIFYGKTKCGVKRIEERK